MKVFPVGEGGFQGEFRELFFKNFELKYRAEKLIINIIIVRITADA